MKKKAVILGSLSQRSDACAVREYLEDIRGVEVLYGIDMNYINDQFEANRLVIRLIKKADVVYAIMKPELSFGESTLYEIALAAELGKPVFAYNPNDGRCKQIELEEGLPIQQKHRVLCINYAKRSCDFVRDLKGPIQKLLLKKGIRVEESDIFQAYLTSSIRVNGLLRKFEEEALENQTPFTMIVVTHPDDEEDNLVFDNSQGLSTQFGGPVHFISDFLLEAFAKKDET